MRSGLWIAGALASGTLVTGCGHGNIKTDETMLGRLSVDDKPAVFTAEHNIEVAKTNKTAAERALDSAQAFRDVANKEADAARDQLDAAQKSVTLGRNVASLETVHAGKHNIQLAEKQLYAYKTKQQYARRLVDLRETEVRLSEQQLELAELDRSIARVESLRKAGLSPLEDQGKLLDQRGKQQSKIAGTEHRIAATRDDVGALRTAWLQRRHGYEVAGREAGVAPLPIPAPPDAHPVEPEPMPMPSGTPSSTPPAPAPEPGHPTPPPPPPM